MTIELGLVLADYYDPFKGIEGKVRDEVDRMIALPKRKGPWAAKRATGKCQTKATPDQGKRILTDG